jgi:hypothetical protein
MKRTLLKQAHFMMNSDASSAASNMQSVPDTSVDSKGNPVLLGKEEIVEIMSLAKEREEPVVLSPVGLGVSFFCLITEVNLDHVLIRNPIPPHLAPAASACPEFSFFCRMYMMKFDHLEPFGTQLRFRLPDHAALNQGRQEERVYFSTKENAVVEIQHPFDPATVMRRRVFDLSKKGMSFRSKTMNPFLQAGRRLPLCQIFLQGLPYEKKQGQIVYVKGIIDVNMKAYFQVGVQFIDDEEES